MPVIAILFGIVIRRHFKEHEPRHFHAEHPSLQGKFDFDGNRTVGNITSKNARVGAAEPGGARRQLG